MAGALETRPGVIEVKWSRSHFCQPRGIEMWESENILSRQMAGVLVSLSIWYDLEWPGQRVSLRDCLDQVDLWACLWGLVLTLNDVEKLSPLWVAPLPGFGSWMV